MTLSARKFGYLQEMSIDLYQRTECVNNEIVQGQHDDSQVQHCASKVEIELSNLANQVIFNDILIALNLTIGGVHQVSSDALDCGAFIWKFHHENECLFVDNTIVTPPVHQLTASPELKRKFMQGLFSWR